MINADLILHARWIVPVQPAEQVLQQHAIVIKAGRIVAIAPSELITQQYHASKQHHLHQHVLIPGLINAHAHSAMSLFRGLADDLPLMDWLNHHIWPAEQQWVSEEFCTTGTELAAAEMIRGGITCFNDMYFFPDAAAAVVDSCGLRASLSLIVMDFPSNWAKSVDEYLDKGQAVFEQYQNHPHIQFSLGPHAPYTVCDKTLQQVVKRAQAMDVQIQMHVHETAIEVQEALQQTGMRPLKRLQKLGLCTPRLQAVHMTQLNDEDMAIAKESAMHVVHCPESNMKLGSGLCKVDQLLQSGINVALGTDGAASNNDLDMLGEMRSAALLAKAFSGNPCLIPSHVALEMATINGAKALGIDHITGSLQVGKAADIVALNLEALETQPIFNPLSHLVYTASRHQVSDVWVSGRQLLSNRALCTIDSVELLNKVSIWQQRLQQSQNSNLENKKVATQR